MADSFVIVGDIVESLGAQCWEVVSSGEDREGIPGQTLAEAFNACDPAVPLPAGDRRHVDLFPARGDAIDGIAQMVRAIRRSRGDHHVVQTLAGQRGCGKSTELRRLEAQLKQDGFFVVYVEINEDVDLEDPGIPDILLSLLRQIEKASREAGHSLHSNLLEDIETWFAEVIETREGYRELAAEVKAEAQAGGDIPFLARLMARVSGILKTGTTSKEEIRRVLDRRISELLDRAKLLTTAVRTAVRKADGEDLVLIVDNLDRIALKDLSDGRNTHEVLFIERGELLREIGCHSVFTVPISLLYSPKQANLAAVFPDSQVLPMVKVVTRQKQPWERGHELLSQLLAHRVAIDQLFEPGTVEKLIEVSGGVPRELVRLVRSCIVMVDEPPITVEVAERAIRKLENDYDRSIPSHHWPLLARVHREGRITNDADHQLMLYNLSVLEYQARQRWCEVHPVIQALEPFEQALAALDAGSAESSVGFGEG